MIREINPEPLDPRVVRGQSGTIDGIEKYDSALRPRSNSSRFLAASPRANELPPRSISSPNESGNVKEFSPLSSSSPTDETKKSNLVSRRPTRSSRASSGTSLASFETRGGVNIVFEDFFYNLPLLEGLLEVMRVGSAKCPPLIVKDQWRNLRSVRCVFEGCEAVTWMMRYCQRWLE